MKAASAVLRMAGAPFSWARRRIAAATSDLVGLAGMGLLCAGVYEVAGRGWALVAAGVPLVALYVWRELAIARHSRRRREG